MQDLECKLVLRVLHKLTNQFSKHFVRLAQNCVQGLSLLILIVLVLAHQCKKRHQSRVDSLFVLHAQKLWDIVSDERGPALRIVDPCDVLDRAVQLLQNWLVLTLIHPLHNTLTDLTLVFFSKDHKVKALGGDLLRVLFVLEFPMVLD